VKKSQYDRKDESLEVDIQTKKTFLKDLERLGSVDQTRVEATVAKFTESLRSQGQEQRAGLTQPHRLRVQDDWNLSLYSLRANRYLRILLTLDNDPVFGRMIVQFLRVVHHDHLGSAFKALGESIAQAVLNGEEVE